MKLRKADALIMISIWSATTLLTDHLWVAIASLFLAGIWCAKFFQIKE
jgi:hypothetical protein